MQSQGSGVPESRYAMSYTHSTLTGDNGADLYGHGPDSYVNVLQHQHQHIGHGGGAGQNSTGHGLGLGSQSHQHLSKRSADVAGLNLKQDPLLGDVTMSTIGMGHGGMDEGPSAGQNGSQSKKTPPPNGKKTKGRVKIKMEFIDNKLRRYTTFSKRKTGIMKKAYELSTLTGTQVMLLVASETGHVYTFATRKLQPMITSEAGKALIQTCLNSPDPPSSTVDQRMSATGFEETELTYTLHDEDQKVRQMMYTGHIPPSPSHPHALSQTHNSHPSHGHSLSHGSHHSHSHSHSHPGLLGPPLGPGPSSLSLPSHHAPSPFPSHGSPSPGPSHGHHGHHIHSQHYVTHGLSSPVSATSGHLTLSPAPTPQPHNQGR